MYAALKETENNPGGMRNMEMQHPAKNGKKSQRKIKVK
jgi:hypothetical protein